MVLSPLSFKKTFTPPCPTVADIGGGGQGGCMNKKNPEAKIMQLDFFFLASKSYYTPLSIKKISPPPHPSGAALGRGGFPPP